MRIAHIVSSAPGMYGKERVIEALIEEQCNKDNTISLFVMDNDELLKTLHHLPITITTFKKTNWGSIMLMYWAIRGFDADIVHTHDYKSGILMLVGLKRMWGKNPQIVRTIHGYTNTGNKFSKIGIYEAVDKFMLRFNDATVGVSEMMGTEFNIPVVRNGISNLPIYYDEELNPNTMKFKPQFLVGCTARLSEEKNLIELVKAFNILPDECGLILFGDGPLMPKIKQTINEQNLHDRVHLAGYDTRAKYYLPYMDAYIQPSLTEGTPISVLEALSAGVPTILTNVGGMIPLIHSGASYPCGIDAAAIARSILAVYTESELRYTLIKNGHEIFYKNYSSQAMARGYQTIYNNLI